MTEQELQQYIRQRYPEENARCEFSKEDIKCNPEVKKLAKFINRQGRKIDKINKMRRSVLGYK